MEQTGQKAESQPDVKQTKGRKGVIFALVAVSHAMNHVQSGVFSVFYPIFRQEFGIAYLGIGFLSTISQLAANLLQIIYGVLTRFVGRGVLLGIGNIIISLGAFGLGFSQGYAQLVTWTTVRSIGSSAQHPVGAATVSSYFPKQRARVLGFHQSAGNIGGWIAPILASSLLFVIGWRHILWLIAIPSLILGLAYFFFREMMVPAKGQAFEAGKKGRIFAAFSDYKAALSNRNILFLSMAMMVGATGRGTGVLSTYLTTYLVDTYHIDVAMAGFFYSTMMFGGIVGPIGIGWLADRISRKYVAQFTLAAAAALNFTVLFYPSANWILGVHLIVAGVFIWSRGPLIETLFTQATDKASLDTLLSVYYTVAFASGPVWTLLIGFVIDRFGFPSAFGVMAFSYLMGMFFLAFVKFDEPGKNLPRRV